MKRIRLFAVLALALLALGLGSCTRRIDEDLSQKVAGTVDDMNAVYDDLSKHFMNHDPDDPYAPEVSPMAGSHTSRSLNFRMNLEDSGEDFAGGLSYNSFVSDALSWNIGFHTDDEDYLSGGARYHLFTEDGLFGMDIQPFASANLDYNSDYMNLRFGGGASWWLSELFALEGGAETSMNMAADDGLPAPPNDGELSIWMGAGIHF
ncbi:MAG: hypothetical protein QGH51_07840 [Planctomycetota bacterium]|jgi:hypothetical protein|nr:hypothetical protein [Planctomycetota bacterium]